MSQTKSKVNDHSHRFSVHLSVTGSQVTNTQQDVYKAIRLVDKCDYGPNVPGWKQALAEGRGVVTSLQGTKYTLKAKPGRVHVVWGPDPSIASFSVAGQTGMGRINPIPPDYSLDSSAERTAASQFLQSYIKATNTFRGGNFAAEVKDTVELVLHPVRSLYKETWEFARHVKRIGRVYAAKPKSAAAALSESWLAFSFGVKPFVQDANDAAAALNVISQGTRHDVRIVKGQGTARSATGLTPFIWSTDAPGVPNSQNLYAMDRVVSMKSVRYKAGIIAKPTGMGNLLNEFGIGVFDVVPAVWEAVPWSFFIDYFANVGEMLDAMRLWSANPAWVVRTVRNSTTQSFRPLPVIPASTRSYVTQEASGSFDLTSTSVKRDSVPIPYPSFRFKLPGTSPYRWLNITSLIGVINDARWGSSKAPPLSLR